MEFSYAFSKAQLKVFSAVCSNFVVVWLVAMLGTNDIFVLTADIFLAILSWKAGIFCENLLEENYD